MNKIIVNVIVDVNVNIFEKMLNIIMLIALIICIKCCEVYAVT